jgi:hypothetical protein
LASYDFGRVKTTSRGNRKKKNHLRQTHDANLLLLAFDFYQKVGILKFFFFTLPLTATIPLASWTYMKDWCIALISQWSDIKCEINWTADYLTAVSDAAVI